MRRGTTPTLNFTLPFNASYLTECYISFAQDDVILLEKELDDCTYADKVLTVVLSQEETLQFDDEKKVTIQIRCKVGTSALASNIIVTTAGHILKEGVI